jgi:hypothetical protein
MSSIEVIADSAGQGPHGLRKYIWRIRLALERSRYSKDR